MKALFIDCETTGTDPDKHGLIQMAGALFVENAMAGQFNYSIQPFPADSIEDEALAVNGRTREEIAVFTKADDVYDDFTGFLGRHCDKYNRSDKIHMIGYNGNFDADFIRAFLLKNGDVYFGSWFWWPIIDVATLAGLRLIHRRNQLRDFKLGTVASALGIVVDGAAHDAMTDIRLTMRIFKVLTRDIGLNEWIGE